MCRKVNSFRKKIEIKDVEKDKIDGNLVVKLIASERRLKL